MLFGLVAVAIPIIIHLLNRRRARMVDWGAMQFLLASLASRNRRILIEEIVLMALRCLTVALLVVAMARPFLPTRTGLSWAVALPAVVIAAVLVAIAGSAWSYRRARWALLAAGAILLLAGAAAVAIEHLRQDRQWSGQGGAEKDIAIVIDGSMSMGLSSSDRTNFQRGLDEARAVIAAARPADAISIILAGPTPRFIVPAPISDRKELASKLDLQRPTNGSMQVLDALNAAASSLAEGHNPGKRVILITDGQGVGWHLDSESRWRFLSATCAELPTRPELICRRLPLPENFKNVCVAGVSLSRKVVGTDRELEISVKLTNTGMSPITPSGLELLIDGEQAARQTVGEITANASETLGFRHRFETHGPKVVTARVICEDDLEVDNAVNRVVNVMEELPVLVVEGAPSRRPLGGAAAFVRIALAPPPDDSPPLPGWRKKPGGQKTPPDGKPPRYLIVPRVVSLTDLAKIEDLSRYRVVILANAAVLPKKFAERLPAFVRKGGGLLIVLGDRCEPRFYNTWIDETGKGLSPAKIKQRVSAGRMPVRLALKTFGHPTLAGKIADPGQSDAEKAAIAAYWRLDTDDKDATVRVGGMFDSGHAFLVERKLGRGFILITAISLDRRDSSLPGLKCFVPLVHELVYFLAEPLAVAGNVKPGTEVALRLPEPGPAAGKFTPGDAINVAAPGGRLTEGVVSIREGKLRAHFTGTEEPGLYRFLLAGSGKGPTTQGASRSNELPFVVLGDPQESQLEMMTEQDFERVGAYVKVSHAHTTDELAAFIAGGVPGQELWKYLVIFAAIALVGEIALTRWIAVRRKAHAIETVRFGVGASDVVDFRARAREMLAVAGPTHSGKMKAAR